MQDLSWISYLPLSQQREILEGPALRPPLGVESNLIDPPNRNQLGYGIVISAAVFSGLLVLLRSYSRIFYHKKVELEDYISVAALGIYAGVVYCIVQFIRRPGAFVHQWNVQLKDITHVLYNMHVGSILYGIAIMLLKTGILVEWSKIFVPRGIKNSFWWTCNIIIAINIVFYTIGTFIEIFGCSPREKLWNLILPGKCLDRVKTNIASAVINFTSDMVILILPQKIIWNLHISLSKKLGIAALFAVGVTATICAGVRIYTAVQISIKDDVTYTLAEEGIWCLAEMTAGFLVLCFPSFPKMFAESPWIHRIFKAVGLRSTSVSSIQGLVTSTRVRTKPARMDGDLFTNSDNSDFVPLTEIKVTTELEIRVTS